LNRTFVLFNINEELDTKEKILNLFENTCRLDSVEFIERPLVEKILGGYEPLRNHHFEKPKVTTKRAALFKFISNSAARKTLDTLKEVKIAEETTGYVFKHHFYWLNEDWKMVRKAEPYRKNYREEKRNERLSFSDSQEETTSNSEGRSESIEDFSASFSSSPCWKTALFPLLEENGKLNSQDEFGFLNNEFFTPMNFWT